MPESSMQVAWSSERGAGKMTSMGERGMVSVGRAADGV